MKTLAQYISLLFIRNFLFAVCALVGVFLLNEILGELLNDEFPFHQVLVFHALKIPEVSVGMIPPAVMMATLLTLAGLNRTNELTAIQSIGIGLNQVLAVLMSIIFMISCFSLVLQDRILPPLYGKRTAYYWREMKKRPDFLLDFKQSKIWYRSENFIYNLRNFDPLQKRIVGMAVYEFDDRFNLKQVLDAQEATFNGKAWTLRDGTVTVFADKDQFPLTHPFTERKLIINETPDDFKEIEKRVDGLRLKELYSYIDRTRRAGIDAKAYEVKFHYRISLSFIPLVMGLLAVPFATRRRREAGAGKDIFVALIFTFLYWLFYALSLSMGRTGQLPSVLGAWLPGVVFAGLAAGLLIKKNRV